ncbi:MAG: hypothetical protein LBQ63_07210 [Deltaproteobacteria bacterium]|nr:hypothetical protein [Deltaproteobacteria bacterium]
MVSGDVIRELFTGQYRILAFFALAVILVYIPAFALVLRRRKKRGEDFLRRHPNAAIVRILRGKTTGILTVHSVDGEKPVLASKGTTWFLYLAPGEHELLLSYQWTKINILGKLSRYFDANQTVSGKTAVKRMTVKAYEKYSLFYDPQTENYKFTRNMSETVKRSKEFADRPRSPRH